MGFVMLVKNRSVLAIAFSAVMLLAGQAQATPITFAGYNFDSDDIADGVQGVDGDLRTYDVRRDPVFNLSPSASELDASIGATANTGVTCVDSNGCVFDILFDGGAANGAGDDILLAGLGGMSELFDVVINGVTLTGQQLSNTGDLVNGFNLKILTLDLSDFGVNFGDIINSVRIVVSPGVDPEEFSLAAALNGNDVAVPLPAGFLIFLGGAAGLFGASRKKKTA